MQDRFGSLTLLDISSSWESLLLLIINVSVVGLFAHHLHELIKANFAITIEIAFLNEFIEIFALFGVSYTTTIEDFMKLSL